MWALGTGRRLQPAPAPGSGFPRVCSGVSSAPEQGHHMYWAPGTCAWGRGGLRTGLAPAVAPLAGARDLGSLARERTDPLGGHPFSLLWFVWNLNKTTLRQAREAACLWPPLRTLEAGRRVRRPRCPHARARARARPQGRPPEAEDAPPSPRFLALPAACRRHTRRPPRHSGLWLHLCRLDPGLDGVARTKASVASGAWMTLRRRGTGAPRALSHYAACAWPPAARAASSPAGRRGFVF